MERVMNPHCSLILSAFVVGVLFSIFTISLCVICWLCGKGRKRILRTRPALCLLGRRLRQRAEAEPQRCIR
jgi:hypothetical protein